MKPYTPTRIRPWSLAASFTRSLARLLTLWSFLLVAAALVSPVGPYLRIDYRYVQIGSHRHITECRFLGQKGWLEQIGEENCPLFRLIDDDLLPPRRSE